jgi:hypothetical protein
MLKDLYERAFIRSRILLKDGAAIRTARAGNAVERLGLIYANRQSHAAKCTISVSGCLLWKIRIFAFATLIFEPKTRVTKKFFAYPLVSMCASKPASNVRVKTSQ